MKKKLTITLFVLYPMKIKQHFFLSDLHPDFDSYRLGLVKVLTLLFMPLLFIESISFLYLNYYFIGIFELIWLGVILYFYRQSAAKPQALVNVFIVAVYSISMCSLFTRFHDPSILLFLVMLPVLYMFFVGLRRAMVWLVLTLLPLAVCMAWFYFQHAQLPWGPHFFLLSIVVFLYCLVLTVAYEKTNQKLFRHMQRMAEYDELTQLYNRGKFYDFFQREIDRVKRYGTSLSVIIIDIDHFKKINDTYGHFVGDAVLSEIATIIQSTLRSTDISGRIGGEEFAVLLPETPRDLACVVAEKIRRNVSTHFFSHIDRCQVSVGVTSYTPDDTVTHMFQRADSALYAAKDGGRNRVECE
ncbi:diguanylate cyclase [bacterium]|nr:diguanylate cyclase [bacterium]